MDPARVLLAVTEFYGVRVHMSSIADNARKTDATLTLGGHRFVYQEDYTVVTQERHLLSHLLYGIVRVVIICN